MYRDVFMRIIPAIFLLLGAAGLAQAGEDATRSQVRAATADAVENLLDEVSRASLTRNLTVDDFLRRSNSRDEMIKVLQRAQQIGGPRWIDDHTCQIELQISGPVVGAALKRIGAANPRHAPLAQGELERAVKQWDERSFSATGAATSKLPAAVAVKARGSDRIGQRRDPWHDVSQAARDQAVAAAKADAARRSLSSVRPISLTPRSTVGDALAIKEVGEGMQSWFASQTPARVELTDDMEAVVELGGTPAETFETFRDLAVKQKEVPLPADDRGWSKAKDEFEHRMVTPIGRAVVAMDGAGGHGVVAAPKPLELPAHAPNWVNRRLEATASGGGDRGIGLVGGSKLHAARAAESAAEEKLRREIEDLELGDKRTLGQAAKDDPRVEQAIRRALARTRIAKADYHANGSADVVVYLDLAGLWQELKDAE
jgi:hypothetical protein